MEYLLINTGRWSC